MKTALTIAGSDSSGGAGIQADIKTITVNGVYAMSAITAVTAQNTLGVDSILPIPPLYLEQQINSVFEDIFPDAVKIGMIPSPEAVQIICNRLKFYKAQNIVLDPVITATSGSVLSDNSSVCAMLRELFPIASIVTPNIPEAEIISGITIKNHSDMERAARIIGDTYSCKILLKGGHNINDANDLLYADGKMTWFHEERIQNPNTHGTGCTLSSAICANLAKGLSLYDSIKNAKSYITRALGAQLDLGKGNGPMAHNYMLME